MFVSMLLPSLFIMCSGIPCRRIAKNKVLGFGILVVVTENLNDSKNCMLGRILFKCLSILLVLSCFLVMYSV